MTLALSTDSSNCGGFNFDQQQPLINDPNQPAVFKANNEDFVVKCSNCTVGDVATFRPVPVPQSLFNVAAGSTVGSGQTCVTFADFSSPNPAQPHGVCPEFQTHCFNGDSTCGDAETFHWQGTSDFIIDQNTILNPIGGVHFLGDPGATCAASLTYSTDTALSYTGVQPGTDAPPLLSGSGGGLNCFVVTYDPTAAAIPIGVTESALGGPFSPVDPPPTINFVNIPSSVPLPFFVANGVGGAPITSLQLCPGGPTAPGSSACITAGVSTPWVYLARVPLACPNAAAAAVNTATESDSVTTVAGLVPASPPGTYNYIWKIKKTEMPNTCASVNIVTSSGAALIPYANFEFVNK